MSEKFFERWSRRKQQVREGEGVPAEPVLPPAPLREGGGGGAQAEVEPRASAPAGEGVTPPPTLADAQALTPESDFKPFMAKNVAPEVRNTAFKKLFADPHFNVMDGMDTYIDDYSQSTPIPPSVLRQMASAKFLKLFDDEEDEAKDKAPPTPESTPTDAAMPDVAQSSPDGDIPNSPPAADSNQQPASQETDDHHADLRLQPDDAARAEDDRRGAG